VLSTISGGAAASFSLTAYAPRILKGDLNPGFYAEHLLKDLNIAMEECKNMNIHLPGLTLVHKLYDQLVNEMEGGKHGT
jgi:3-hydroxyisobutyrate dehydrogenase